ncbi:hypothetical protein FRC02_012238 [Tulasnella sp. 418]|nr:hypothetical protein FRC02_012238 [Tulasnella sp. 418]
MQAIRRIKVATDENPGPKIASGSSSISSVPTGKTGLSTAGSVRSALGDLSNNARKFAKGGKDKFTAAGGIEKPAASTSLGHKRSASAVSIGAQRQSTSSKPSSVIARPPTRPGRSLSVALSGVARSMNGGSVRPLPSRGKTSFIPTSKSKQSSTYQDDSMEISDQENEPEQVIEIKPETPVDAMVEEEIECSTKKDIKPPHVALSVEADVEVDEDDWTFASPSSNARFQAALEEVRANFKDEIDEWDVSMVSEYADEIFEYMGKLETSVMPCANYMEGQSEIEWSMRRTLIDWLLQVHLRYHMLPETLWIAVNIVDRFLSRRVVSLVKLQLVGVTAMFIASKYEEIMAPSVDEFAYMTEHGYTREEILKGEKIVLQTIEFNVSSYCSPYSWVRRISKADDYDIQTRTLCKFLMEVTLLDHRFLRAKPSMIAAIGMYTSKRMLGGEWDNAFIYYSNYTEAQLLPGFLLLVEDLAEDDFESQYVCKKYANKKFLKASLFARDWSLNFVRENRFVQ